MLFAAEAPAPAALTLAESIRRGLSYSLEFQKAESEKRQADAEFRLARAKVMPTLDMNASVTGTETAENYGNGFGHAYKARLDLEQPLFTGGALANGLRAARMRREVAEKKWQAVRHDYTFKVVEAYYKAAQAQVLLAIAKENREILKNYLAITTRYAAIGRSKGIDRLQAEASYNLSESQVLESESTLEGFRQDLIRLLGEDQGLEAPLDPRLSLQAFDPGSLDKMLRQALEQNPAIQALSLQADSLTYENRARMFEHRPTLSARGSYGYDSPEYDRWIKDSGEAYSFGLVLKIPLFSGFSSLAQSDQLAEQRVQLEKDLAIRRKELQKTLATALATLQRDFTRLKHTQVSSASSKKAMDVAVRDYRNGLLSSTDVLNIQRTRFEADRQHTLAQYSYNQQMLNLRRDIGADLQKIYEGK